MEVSVTEMSVGDILGCDIHSIRAMSIATPNIPLREINALIPRITSAINDIDAFKALLASGHADGTLPNW